MNIIITGKGEEILYLIKNFLSNGEEVCYIGNDKEICIEYAKLFENLNVIFGDPSKPEIFKEAHPEYADLLISINDKDQDTLITAQLAKKIYHIPKVLAVVKNPKNIDIFNRLGIDNVISITSTISSIIEQKVLVEEITKLIEIEEQKASVIQIKISSKSQLINKSLKEIEILKNVIIGCIIRDNKAIIPKGNTIIKKNDKLIIIYLPENENDLIKIL